MKSALATYQDRFVKNLTVYVESAVECKNCEAEQAMTQQMNLSEHQSSLDAKAKATITGTPASNNSIGAKKSAQMRRMIYKPTAKAKQ